MPKLSPCNEIFFLDRDIILSLVNSFYLGKAIYIFLFSPKLN